MEDINSKIFNMRGVEYKLLEVIMDGEYLRIRHDNFMGTCNRDYLVMSDIFFNTSHQCPFCNPISTTNMLTILSNRFDYSIDDMVINYYKDSKSIIEVTMGDLKVYLIDSDSLITNFKDYRDLEKDYIINELSDELILDSNILNRKEINQIINKIIIDKGGL